MKITALEVDRFGIWSGLKLDEIADGLCVVYGPNEAGKTTLMQFVRSVFYGFSPDRRRYLPEEGGTRSGGSIQVIGTEGRFRISRHANSRRPDAREELALSAADGSRPGEHLLRGLLSNLDEPVFQNVFAIGLREIQELGTLSDTKAASLLYSISAGVDRVALVDVMRTLEQSRSRLLDPAGGSGQIFELAAQRDQLAAGLEHTRTALRRFERLAAERDQFEREAARFDEENRRLQHEHRTIEIALAIRDRWRRRAALDDQLAALGPAGLIPEDAVERLDAINARHDQRQRRLDQLKHQYDQLRAEAAGLKVNDTLLRQAPRIEAMQDQAEWIGTVENRILELDIEISELEEQLKSEHERFGLGKNGGTRAFPSISGKSLSALRLPAAALRRCKRRLEEAGREVGKGQETARSIHDQIERTLSERNAPDLPTVIERTAAQVALLRRRVQIDERLDQMDLYQQELEEQSRGLLDGQLLPARVLLLLGLLFVAGPMLLLLKVFGMLVSGAMSDPLSWTHVGLGILCTFAAFVGKFVLERINARRLGDCQQQLHMLQLQMKQANEEREALDRQLPRGAGPMMVRLQTAEKDLEHLEELVPLDARRQAAQEDSESAGQRVHEAEAEMTAVRRRWREAIAVLGLPQDLSPKQVRQLAASCGRVQEIQQRLERLREESQQRRREMDFLCGRIQQVVAETGLTLQQTEPVRQLDELAERLADHETRLKRRTAMAAQGRRLRKKRAKYESLLRRLKTQRKKLLREVKVEDEREFRRKAAELQRIGDLRRERSQLAREIEAAITGHCTEEEILGEIDRDPFERIEVRAEAIAEKLRANEAQLHARFEKRGQIAEQLKALAEDRGPALKSLELAMVQQRLDDAIRRWQTLAVTSRILLTVRKIYEKDRQPETLREASGYLGRMTEGRYVRIWTPLGEDVLMVEDAQGGSRSVEQLSRGTREQLFLSLRLALANGYARRGVQMPMILDDVLVNFDGRRAKATAAVLRDFAAGGRQVLVFTCHEHIVRLFQALHVPLVQLPERQEPTPAVAATAPPATPEKQRKPKPPLEPAPPTKKPRRRRAKPKPEPELMPVEELAPWEEADDRRDTYAAEEDPFDERERGDKEDDEEASEPESNEDLWPEEDQAGGYEEYDGESYEEDKEEEEEDDDDEEEEVEEEEEQIDSDSEHEADEEESDEEVFEEDQYDDAEAA
ncbi:MAG: AAA family ATPase [Rhodopirellula sp.]|nr:AAA family ATPase [Rhodopirellula sp.]